MLIPKNKMTRSRREVVSEKQFSLQGDRQLWGQGDRKLFHFCHHWFRLTASPRVVKYQAPMRGL